MPILRAASPVVRNAVQRTSQSMRVPARRFFNSETAPIIFSANAKVTGARAGHIEGDDLVLDLALPKAFGGKAAPGKTNPEELFAAGYGACFQSAMNASAAMLKIKMPSNPEDSIVQTTVHLVGDAAKVNMGIRVDMKVKVRGLAKDQVDRVVAKAKEVCPYSKAIQGNVHTAVEIVDA